MLLDHAVLADVDPVLEAKLVRHLALRALAQTHRTLNNWSSLYEVKLSYLFSFFRCGSDVADVTDRTREFRSGTPLCPQTEFQR